MIGGCAERSGKHTEVSFESNKLADLIKEDKRTRDAAIEEVRKKIKEAVEAKARTEQDPDLKIKAKDVRTVLKVVNIIGLPPGRTLETHENGHALINNKIAEKLGPKLVEEALKRHLIDKEFPGTGTDRQGALEDAEKKLDEARGKADDEAATEPTRLQDAAGKQYDDATAKGTRGDQLKEAEKAADAIIEKNQ